MKKIAFVNQRYGMEVNGGSEVYTREMAEHLCGMGGEYEVEILTSTAKNNQTWESEYPEGKEFVHGVTIRRFAVKHPKRLTRFKILNKLCVQWNCSFEFLEKLWIREQGPLVPKLIEYIQKHQEEYDAFIFVTYLYYPVVYGLPEVSQKAIFVPTAHDEPMIHLQLFRKLFQMPKALVFLTEEEKNMVHRLFNNEKIPSSVIGFGIDESGDAVPMRFREKYHIEGEYLIYVGRVEPGKGCDVLFDYFSRWSKMRQDIKLVVLGQVTMELPKEDNVLALGFVEESEKQDAIAGAKALMLPSEHESLSISVLEAMSHGIPVVVNGWCEVLQGHCKRSRAGYFYTNYTEFSQAVEHLWTAQYSTLCENAREYVDQNYRWEGIMREFRQVLEESIHSGKAEITEEKGL